MKRLIHTSLLALLALPASLLAQEGDRPSGVAEIEELMTTRMPSSEWPERNRKIAAWLKSVEEDDIDLGKHSYLQALAHYFARNYEKAGEMMSEYLDRHEGQVPNPALNTVVGRVVMTRAAALADEGKTEDFLKAADRCLALYEPRSTIYRVLCSRLLRNEKQRPILHALLAKMLRDEAMTTEDREELLTTCYAPRKEPSRPVEGPKELKAFEAVDLDGEKQSLQKYRGKVLLVDFWATWCGPCIREMPHVVKAYEKHHDDGFEVLAISLDQEPSQKRGEETVPPSEETIEKIRAKTAELDMTWPCIYEGGGWGTRLAKENGIRSIPATFLLDRSGKVRYTNLRGAELARRVAELLEEK